MRMSRSASTTRPSWRSAGAELYGGWMMVLSGLKTLLETGQLLTTPFAGPATGVRR